MPSEKLNSLFDSIIQDIKNINNVVDIIAYKNELTNENTNSYFFILKKLILHFHQSQLFLKESSGLEKFSTWLLTQYDQLTDIYTKDYKKGYLKKAYIPSILNILKHEKKLSLIKTNILQKYIKELCFLQSLKFQVHIKPFIQYISYPDVNYYFLKEIYNFMTDEKNDESIKLKPEFADNILFLLFNITIKANDCKTGKVENFYKGQHVSFKGAQYKQMLSKVWIKFLTNYQLTPGSYKKILNKLDHLILPNLEKPLQLADFLIASFEQQGAAIFSEAIILCLNAIFTLMQKHGLEYPNFYAKLFEICTAQNLQIMDSRDEVSAKSQYRKRFFNLLDLCMTSTHVPGYILMAFITRILHLINSVALMPTTVLIGLGVVQNMMVRHTFVLDDIFNIPNQDITDNNNNNNILQNEFTTPIATFITEMCENETCGDVFELEKARASSQSFAWYLLALKTHTSPTVSEVAQELCDQIATQLEQNLKLKNGSQNTNLFGEETKKKQYAIPEVNLEPLYERSKEEEIFRKDLELPADEPL